MLPGVVGTIQATEIIKLILDSGVPLIGRLMLYDAMKMNFKEVRVRKDPECALCGDVPTVTELIDYKNFCDVPLPGAASTEEIDESLYEMNPLDFKQAMDQDPKAVLVDVRETFEWDICRIEGAKLLPLSQFDSANTGLDPDSSIFLYCYMGKRSMTALKELKSAGFSNLKSMKGGIYQWAEDVDNEMPQY